MNREIDLLVATRFMGWTQTEHSWISPDDSEWVKRGCNGMDPIPRYSEDIGAAWELVDQIDLDVSLEIFCGFWTATQFYIEAREDGLVPRILRSASFKTPSMALCLLVMDIAGIEIKKSLERQKEYLKPGIGLSLVENSSD